MNDLIAFYEKMSPSSKTIYPVQFILKSHAYDARMYFLAGNLNLAKAVLGKFKNTEVYF